MFRNWWRNYNWSSYGHYFDFVSGLYVRGELLFIRVPTIKIAIFFFLTILINIFTIHLIEFKGQDKPGGCYFKEPTTGFPKYLLNATGTVKTSSKVVESLTTPFPPTEQ